MALPHRDDVPVLAPPGPHDHDHSFVKKPCADLTNFTIIEPVIDNGHCFAGKNLPGVKREIQTSMFQLPSRLARSKVTLIPALCSGKRPRDQRLCNYIMPYRASL